MTPNELIQAINRALKIDIKSKSRKRDIVYARFIFYNKLRNSKDRYYSFQNIGDFLSANKLTELKPCEFKIQRYNETSK